MKRMKKVLSVLLTLVMVLAMAVPSFAATTSGTNADPNESGKIIISNVTDKQAVYSIYKLFDLESFSYEDDNKTDGKYSYYITSDSSWYAFVTDEDEDGANYITLTPAGMISEGVTKYYVTWKGDDADLRKQAFAQAALQFAKEDVSEVGESYKARISPDETKDFEDGVTAGEKTTITFDELPLGYYLVDSSVGALCALNTTDTEATIAEKNEVPAITKTVDAEQDGTENVASVGDELEFTITIENNKGAQNYVITDTMSKGLTYEADSFKVYKNTVDDANEVKNVDGGTTYYSAIPDTNNTTKITTLTITFTDSFYEGLQEGDKIIITYKATINGDAVVVDELTNTANLAYGTGHTVNSTTKTYTYDIGVIKTDGGNFLLPGAEFELYSSTVEGEGEDEETVPGDQILVVGVLEDGTLATSETDADDIVYYRPAEKTEIDNAVVIKAGNIVIRGLGNGIYFLNETKAPEGYNKLFKMAQFEVDGKDNLVDDLTENNEYDADINGGVQVVNNTGSLLPSTGGIGTTVFYAAGIILMAGAVFFIVRRKRA